ncbi:ATP-binding protein [Streptomyces sp. NPDC059096]|uniref:ATP-binding protein n=1 Tax=Streptomyces sp. NPDC059096 TaxID=3346727 RepID=UPI003686B922
MDRDPHSIEVADEGPGIEPGEAPRVFDRFYRATPPGRDRAPGFEPRPEPGSGLGLAIAAAIAAAHGGRLELDNRPGTGCAFRLLLPDPTTAPGSGAGTPGRTDPAGPARPG